MTRTTMLRTVVLLALVIGSVAPVAAGGRGGRGGPPGGDSNPRNDVGPIQNHVVDLLDTAVTLVAGEEPVMWESEPFATARFTKIGLRASTAEESLSVSCRVCWQYEPGDECIDGAPAFTTRGSRPFTTIVGRDDLVDPPIGDDPTLQRPTGDVSLGDGIRQYYPMIAPTSLALLDFTDVRGLRARVRCSIPLIVFIGDDPGDEQEPDDPGPDLSATLTDVKLLLRR